MPSTERRPRRIDIKLPASGGGSTADTATTEPVPPSVPQPGPPTNLQVGVPFVVYSAVTPSAAVNLTWYKPTGYEPDGYVVQWATDSGFTAPTTRPAPRGQTFAGVDGLPVSTTVYFRVAAVLRGIQSAWTASVNATTPSDTTPPAAPTSFAYSWSGLTGDLTLTWTNPTSANFRDVRVRIYASNGGTLLREGYSATGAFVWTRGQHYSDTSGAFDPAVYVVLTARSWGGVFSATDLTGSPTLAAPTAPAGLTSSWASDTGVAGPDLLITWTRAEVADYELTLNSTARRVGSVGRYLFAFEQNQAENAGTADPSITVSLVAIDALGQSSTASTISGGAVNAAPPATTITAFGAAGSVGLTIVASAAKDLLDYEVKVYKSAVLVDTVYLAKERGTYTVEDGDGSYTFTVAPRDVFLQVATHSAATAPVALIDWGEFVTDLRSGLTYFDDLGTSAATLAGLKDGILTVDVVAYAAGSTWKKTTGDWQYQITHRTSEVVAGNDINAIIAVSDDLLTWTYYYGGTPAGGLWEPASSTSTEATALAGAITLTGGVTWRIELPAPKLCRYIRLYHRRVAGTYALREFFPSTLLRGTYVEAESITTVNIASNFVLADSAAIGALDGYTITGALIRTAATGARIELSGSTLESIDSSGDTRVSITPDGLKTYDSAGVVQVEATTATDGALKAGAGAVTLDDSGLSITMQASSSNTTGTLRFISTLHPGVSTGALTTWESAGQLFQRLSVQSDSTQTVDILLEAWQKDTAAATVALEAQSGDVGGTGLVPEYTVRLALQTSSTVQRATLSGGPLYVESQLNAYSLATGVTKRLLIAYDDTNDRGVIQAIHDSVAVKPLVIQPSGGDVTIGSASNTIGLNGSTIGTAGALAGYLIVQINGTNRKIPYYAT